MTHLPNAPVRYVLGVLRFPRTSDPQKLAASIQPNIRQDYPISAEFSSPQVHLEVGPKGVHVEQQSLMFWQFASLEKDWAVLVGSDMIALHTVNYVDRHDFIRRFSTVADRAFANTEHGIQFIQAIAMRYVDVVEPRPEETLEHYLVPSVLPTSIRIAESSLEGGVMATTYKTESGRLRVQVLRRPPSVLPPDLMNPMVEANGWAQECPQGDFAVLDLDHGQGFETPILASEANVSELLRKLHSTIRSMFDAAVTPHAMAVWKERRE